MTSPKKRRRARRQVERTMAEAFEALERGETALAEKLGRRAVDAGPVNPRIWFDHGRLSRRLSDHGEALRSFRQAARIAPNFAAALFAIAEIYAAQGRFARAVEFAAQAAVHAPDEPDYRAHLEAWRGELSTPAAGDDDAEDSTTRPARRPPRSERTARYDWEEVADSILRHGFAHLPALLDRQETAALDALWETGDLREAMVELQDASNREEPPLRAEQRSFRAPLPQQVLDLRRELYGRAVEVAAQIDARLGRSEARAGTLEEHLGDESGSGPWPGVWLLRLDAAARTKATSPPRPRTMFPLGVAIDLGGDGHTGSGSLFVEDLRPGKKVRRQTAATERAGDGLLYLVGERPVTVGDRFGLQRVATGREPAVGGRRHFLELRFDDE